MVSEDDYDEIAERNAQAFRQLGGVLALENQDTGTFVRALSEQGI